MAAAAGPETTTGQRGVRRTGGVAGIARSLRIRTCVPEERSWFPAACRRPQPQGPPSWPVPRPEWRYEVATGDSGPPVATGSPEGETGDLDDKHNVISHPPGRFLDRNGGRELAVATGDRVVRQATTHIHDSQTQSTMYDALAGTLQPRPRPRLRLWPRLGGGNYRDFFAVVFLFQPRPRPRLRPRLGR